MKKTSFILVLAFFYALTNSAFSADKMIVGLITKTNINPFFVKMREGAKKKAEEVGIELRTFAGKYDSDSQTQIEAIESLMVAGAKGILITPADSVALVPAVRKARQAGILVIALDTPLDPASAADITFATDNFKAGELIGKWAAAKLGKAGVKKAKIALLDLNPSEISVDVARNQGFLKGFGIELADPSDIGDEKDKRIVGNDITQGNEEGGRTAMENLLQKDQNINVVYTINEPAAVGAYEALKAFGKTKGVLIVSVDGGCPGVRSIADGVIGATSMQFPLKMASLGIEAIVEYSKSKKKPKNSPGLDFYNTGVELITDEPVKGIPSLNSKEGLKQCWG